jgi:hypothetical protein
VKRILDRHIGIQCQFARQVTGARLHRHRVGLGVYAQHPHGAAVGADQVQQAADGRGFPGSVGTEIAKRTLP